MKEKKKIRLSFCFDGYLVELLNPKEGKPVLALVNQKDRAEGYVLAYFVDESAANVFRDIYSALLSKVYDSMVEERPETEPEFLA